MKDIFICTDLKIGDGQKRNNEIKDGVIIDITPKSATLPTVLVQDEYGEVVAVRYYPPDWF